MKKDGGREHPPLKRRRCPNSPNGVWEYIDYKVPWPKGCSSHPKGGGGLEAEHLDAMVKLHLDAMVKMHLECDRLETLAERAEARVAAMEKALGDHCGQPWYEFDEFEAREREED